MSNAEIDKTSEDYTSLLRRVQKLMAIATDSRGNANEAAAAAIQAEKIMRKYQIDHSEVIITRIRQGEDMTEAYCEASAKTNGTPVKEVPSWAGIIGLQVGLFMDCHVMSTRIPGTPHVGVRFAGYKTDVEVAKWVFEYLLNTVLQLCRKFKTSSEYQFNGPKALNPYRQGLAVGICQLLTAERKRKAAEAAVMSSATALVVVKTAAVTERYGTQVTRKSTSQVAFGANYVHGIIDGRKVDINRRGVGGPAEQTKLGVK